MDPNDKRVLCRPLSGRGDLTVGRVNRCKELRGGMVSGLVKEQSDGQRGWSGQWGVRGRQTTTMYTGFRTSPMVKTGFYS